MKTGELIDLLMTFNPEDEISIDIHETVSGKYVDSTSAVAIVEDAFEPTFKIDVEAGKFEKFITSSAKN